jgi:hypothetical protein
MLRPRDLGLLALALILWAASTGVRAESFVPSGGWRLLEADEISVDTWKYDDIHDPYLSPDDSSLSYGAAFNTNFTVASYNGYGLRMDNNLHFDEDGQTGQVRAVGWQYGLYLTVLRIDGQDKIEIFRQHHSQHIVDRSREDHFPVYDRNGVRWVIYQRNSK